ncbi:hypothetical protein SLITK23_12670 [Streptomyces lividans]|nr:hypothetical protein SLITK23_12670 [Streptomyces lividans]GHA21723.1 hypothetical protein GCM10010391_01230 [Streptomyces anthocyanicus]GHB94154.1 hypothetical protein GCM10010348_12030 [Streptomyces anthocyanicus]
MIELGDVVAAGQDPEPERGLGDGGLSDGEPGVAAAFEQQHPHAVTCEYGPQHRPADAASYDGDIENTLVFLHVCGSFRDGKSESPGFPVTGG